MNFDQFINQPIINKNEERGIVVQFDETYITIKYEDKETVYSSDTSLSNKYLEFVDDKFNIIIDKYLHEKEKTKRDKEMNIQRVATEHKENLKRINDRYIDLYFKNKFMRKFFGYDFKYPPYVEFMKKYKNVIYDPVDPVTYDIHRNRKYREY